MAVEVVVGECPIVRVTGEIDIANVGELESALGEAVERSPDGFIVDASRVSYIDATGMRAILVASERVNAGGGAISLVVAGIAKRIADLLGLEKLPCLLLFGSLEAAFDALARCKRDGR